MDRLDALALLGIAAVVAGALAVTRERKVEARWAAPAPPPVAATPSTDEAEAQAAAVRRELEAGRLDSALPLALALVARHPAQAAPYMLLGDVYLRRQAVLEAIREYRRAVDLNPDYVDKNTASFQGKKLDVAVREALDTLDAREEEGRLSPEGDRVRRDVYDLQRRIAGGCG